MSKKAKPLATKTRVVAASGRGRVFGNQAGDEEEGQEAHHLQHAHGEAHHIAVSKPGDLLCDVHIHIAAPE